MFCFLTLLCAFQAYVSKQRPFTEAPIPQSKNNTPTSGFAARFRQSLAVSPILPHRHVKRDSKDLTSEKEDKRKSSTLANFNKKLSKSIHDIFHLGRLGGNDDDGDQQREKSNRSV